MKNANSKTLLENAVVGIVDMVSSTKLSNEVDVFTDWEIKERFLQAAQARAEETGIIILSLTGDGFLFLANPKGGVSWARSIQKFQTLLVADFRALLAEYAEQIGSVKSGIRIGVAKGPVIIGQLRANAQSMAVGAAINLAARLCASAKVDEMAMSGAVWEVYSALVSNAEAAMCAFERMKGFDQVVVGFLVAALEPLLPFVPKRDVRKSVSHEWAPIPVSRAA